MSIDWAMFIEAAVYVFGSMLGAAIGTVFGLSIWTRRMYRKYDNTPPTTTTSESGTTTHGLRRVS